MSFFNNVSLLFREECFACFFGHVRVFRNKKKIVEINEMFFYIFYLN